MPNLLNVMTDQYIEIHIKIIGISDHCNELFGPKRVNNYEFQYYLTCINILMTTICVAIIDLFLSQQQL